MSHFGDHMDGVPVKISEKYKRPPRIELPYSVIESPLRAQHAIDNAKYCSTFETNVLSKLKELRKAKETKKSERRHRLQILEEAKQKKLDALAIAEEEERMKQLSVSEVSYPSTDEISALSPDEKVDRTCDTNTTQDNTPEAVAAVPDASYPSTSTAADSQLNILQPVQVKSNYQNNLLDDPDPLQGLKMNMKVNKINYNRNVETLTFRDFENDTSSPFDNVELKTINDMELLAQVLQSQRESTTGCQPQNAYISEQTYTLPNCASQVQAEGMAYLPNTYMEPAIQGPNVMYASPNHYPVTNGYYIPTDNDTMYMHNYQYYVPNNPQYPAVDPTYYNPIPTTSGEVVHMPNGAYIPQPYYYQYPQMPMQYQPNTTYNVIQTENVENQNTMTQTVKSRSRSVPDIVRELNEELASAKIRANERSYNVSPAPKVVPQTSSSCQKEEKKIKRKSEHLPNPFEKLMPELQWLCRKISGMGFPLDRVARVVTLLGDNDKKVIEGLLMIGELIDLGFSERRVSAALAKHQFNKDKALDELVS